MHGTKKICYYETNQKHIKFQQNKKRIFTGLKEKLGCCAQIKDDENCNNTVD